MNSQNNQTRNECKLCGRCCYMEIPVTLLDIHRIAKHKKVSAEIIFRKIVNERLSQKSSVFMIQKNRKGACIFLGIDQKCTIHEVKPNICSFYQCSKDSKKDRMPWIINCKEENQRAKLWEQSIAIEVTKAYIKKNGTAWCKNDFTKAIDSIFANIKTNRNEKLKLTKDARNRPQALLYNCSTCHQKGICASETPVTLLDIKKIIKYLGIKWSKFFDKYIDKEKSNFTGGLQLKRPNHCIFYNHEKKGCGIEEVSPLHCKFTACPQRVKNSDMMNKFYLGSGSLEDQFKHHIAISVTREYVAKWGTECRLEEVEKGINKIRKMMQNKELKSQFIDKIADFRYIDDTPSFNKNEN
mgnify:CR=1 FL=1